VIIFLSVIESNEIAIAGELCNILIDKNPGITPEVKYNNLRRFIIKIYIFKGK